MAWLATKDRWLFLAANLLLICVVSACASSRFNQVVLVKNKDGTQFQELLTEHYLFVDGDHVAEAERGERRLLFQLRSRSGGASLRTQLKLYPEDASDSLQLELLADGRTLLLPISKFRRWQYEEEVTLLGTGDGIRVAPTIGNDIQAQSGYITFGKPTGAQAAKRNWQVVVLESELDSTTLNGITRVVELSVRIAKISGITATAEFSTKQVAAWRRFAEGKVDTVTMVP
ncbi:MAG: hypothetical protein N2Z22_04580 [Turneriella sp.]|nr:hypothetical protein [Turneriella sp.]